MNKEFIPYEEALALKKLGFDELCFMFYEQETSFRHLQKGINSDYWGDYSDPQKWNSMPNKPWKPFCQCISAPLYQQSFRFFREKYDLIGWICPFNNGKNESNNFLSYGFAIKDVFIGKTNFDNYEEAELACLKKLIEICQKK